MLMNKESNDNDAISGGVDKSEIEAALNQSKPTLPTLPVNSVNPIYKLLHNYQKCLYCPSLQVQKCLGHHLYPRRNTSWMVNGTMDTLWSSMVKEKIRNKHIKENLFYGLG